MKLWGFRVLGFGVFGFGVWGLGLSCRKALSSQKVFYGKVSLLYGSEEAVVVIPLRSSYTAVDQPPEKINIHSINVPKP